MSELSKPVAWTWNAYGMPHATTEEDESEELILDGIDVNPLYSQEYVSALTQRIAELSRLLAHNIERAEAAEAKLATPVRLPDIRFINVGETPVAVMHAISVKEQIRRAGFKVEGDE